MGNGLAVFPSLEKNEPPMASKKKATDVNKKGKAYSAKEVREDSIVRPISADVHIPGSSSSDCLNLDVRVDAIPEGDQREWLDSTIQEISKTSYDEVPYPSYPYAAAHPDRLFSIAKLFGLNAKDPAEARVLELGCAAGGNLLPIAARYPKSECIGVDLSAIQVDDGLKTIKAIGLKNARLLKANLAKLPKGLGKFDYIICHGVFSWVPNEVQEAIFQIHEDLLASDGIGYVSYNTLPGWYMRNAIRGMLLKHVGAIADSTQKLAQSRALLKFLVESTEGDNSPYASFLKSETELLGKQSDQYLYHEHLEDNNHPCFFQDFIARANQKGLQFLGESSLPSMWTGNLPLKAQQTLSGLTKDVVLLGQYADFVRNRTFRQTLLCRLDRKLDRQLSPDRIRPAFFRGRFAVDGTDALNLSVGVSLRFKSTSGHNIQTSDSVYKAMLAILTEVFPAALDLGTIAVTVKSRLESEMLTIQGTSRQLEDYIATLLLKLMLAGAVEFSFTKDGYATKLPDKPEATSLCRWQASNSAYVTNLRHEVIKLGEVERLLLCSLDGKKNIASVCEHAAEMVRSGKLNLNSATPLSDAQKQQALRGIVEKVLRNLAVQGLFLSAG